MTTREALHHLVDELPEEQTELRSSGWRISAMPPTRMDLRRCRGAGVARPGLADVAAGRVKPLAEYEHERGLSSYRVNIAHEAEKVLDRLDRSIPVFLRR